ncbi:MAG: DNA polymerase III subunit beta [Deltaproteobacteria bacterium]|nr:DNA polymerase III subunit beta [Deltaproteobacteria bacterium]
MEIKVGRNDLFKIISRVQSIIEKRSNMPILSNVLITAAGTEIHVSATDLELSYLEIIPGVIIDEGSLTISGRKLFEILKESRADEFYIKEKENNWVFISDNIARFDLACLSAEDYPSSFEPEGVLFADIDGENVSEMINKTIYSATVEDAGYNLSGIFTEKIITEGEKGFKLRMVSTDGHRLSMVDRYFEELENLYLEKGVMIPKKGMIEINKMASDGGRLSLGFKEKNCVVKKENAQLVIRLLDSKFPDYNAVIPKEMDFSINVSRILFLEAMRKMMILSNERYRAVKIGIENNQMELVSTNPDLGEARENIKVEYNGKRLEAGFNPRYFIDALQSMQSEVINIGFIDNSKPCVLTGEADEGFLGLIMPMRV